MPTTPQLPPLGHLGLRTLAAREARKARLAVEVARFQRLNVKYPPLAPKLHKLADVEGRWWQHADGRFLARWIAERDKALRAAKAAASSSRGWRADGPVENKAIWPND